MKHPKLTFAQLRIVRRFEAQVVTTKDTTLNQDSLKAVSHQWRKSVQCLRQKRLVKSVRKGIWSLTRRGEKLVARRQQERANLMAQIDELNERFGDEQIPKAVTKPQTKLKLVRL